MAGFRCLKRDPEAFGVTHLSNDDHIRVLPEDMSQPVLERRSVGEYFPLVYIAVLMFMEIFDRVFKRYDVAFSLCVDNVYQRRKCCGFPMAGRSGYQDKPLCFQGVLVRVHQEDRVP